MEKLLTPQDLANKTGLAVQTIYNRRCNGGSLPRCINTGRLIRFRPCDVDAWYSQMYELPAGENDPTDAIGNHTEKSEPRRRGRPTKAEQIARRKPNHF